MPTLITPSASSATAPSATDSVPPVSPLESLLNRAQAASERMSVRNPNRALLKDLAIALVAQARMIADLSHRDESRIIRP